MKSLICSLGLVLISLFSYGQYTITQNLGSANTLVQVPANGGLRGGLIPLTFADTTAANLSNLKFYAGAEIYTSSPRAKWWRDLVGLKWVQYVPAGGGSGGTYSWNIGGNTWANDVDDLTFGSLSQNRILFKTTDATRLILDSAGIVRNNTAVNRCLVIDTVTKVLYYTDCGTGGGATPTWQQTLTAGSTLTGNNTVDGGANDFSIYDLGEYGLSSIAGGNIASFGMGASGITLLTNNSRIDIYDSIALKPYLGLLYIDTLNASNNADDSMLVRKASTGKVGYRAIPTGGGSGANALGTYLVQTATNAPANAQVMGALATGIVKNTTTTGVQSIAVAGTDYVEPTNYYGQIYTASTWANLNDFTNSGATVAASGGKLVFTGGASDFYQSLNVKVNQSKGLTNYYTNLERWRMKMRFEVISTGIVGIGTRGTTINSFNSGAFAYINTSTGESVFGGASASNLSISLNDVIEIIAEKNGFNTMIQVRNVTTNSATITTKGQYLISGGVVPVTGQFAIFNYSGNFNTTYLEVDSKAPMYADLLCVGTSKTQGYNANYMQRYPSLLTNYYNVVAHGGGYETTADWETTVQEVVALKPKAVTLEDPCNDLRTGVNVDSTKARYYRMEAAFRAAGINVYHLNGFYENTAFNPTAWKTYIESTRSADSIIDTYTPSSTVNGYLDADNVHPTVFGMTVISNAILSSNKIKGAINPSLAPTNFITAQTTTEQSTGFNIGGTNSTLRANLTIGNATAGQVQFKVRTGPDYNLEMYSDGSSNNIYSLNDARNAARPLLITGSTVAINSGSVQTATFGSGGSTNLYGSFEMGSGTDLTSTVAIKEQVGSNYNFERYTSGGIMYMNTIDNGRSTYRPFTLTSAAMTLSNSGTVAMTLTGGKVGVGASVTSPTTGLQVGNRFASQQGADVASVAGAIAFGTDGNSFEITGTNAITLISNSGWVNGSEVTFLFTSTATLTDGTANSGTDIGMELAGNANFVASAGATVTLILSEIGGTQRWREVSRSVN